MCQQKTVGPVCVGFSAEESCSAVCHFSFRSVEQRDFYYGECAREGAIALKKKKGRGKSSSSV